jgi:hypothetical protein
MKTIFADFNAMTEAGHVSLSTCGSEQDVQRAGARPGDWAWLSDGELIVGAQLAVDDRHGLVGVPDWETLVHLDDEGVDYDRVTAELNPMLTREPPSAEDEPRIFQLLIQFEHVAPPHTLEALPGMFAFRRALALRLMGKLGLALLETAEARLVRPGDPDISVVYLELLRREDLPAAVVEAEVLSRSPSLPALVLSACINVLATQADQSADDQFESIADHIFALCRRFDQAPDLDQAGRSLVALSHFNRGMVHLRAARISQARKAFETAYQLYPEGPTLAQLRNLQTYDHHAREVASSVRQSEVASSVRQITERSDLSTMVAA